MIKRICSVLVLGVALASCASFDEFVEVMAAMDSEPVSSDAVSSEAVRSEGEASGANATRQPDARRAGRFSSAWEWVSPATGSYDLRAIAVTSDGFFAAGDGGAILRSAEGESWDYRQIGVGNISHAAYGNGAYVIAGDLDEAPLHFSFDGQAWYISEFEEPVADRHRLQVRGLTWTGDDFLLNATETEIGSHGRRNRFYRSTDGHRWHSFESEDGAAGDLWRVNGMIYSSGGGSRSVLRYSQDDGRSWEEADPVDGQLFSGITSVAYNPANERYIALRPHNWMAQTRVYESFDGIDWELMDDIEGGRFIAAAPHGDGFLLTQVHDDAVPYFELQGAELSPLATMPVRSDGVSPEVHAFVYTDDRLVGVGPKGSLVTFNSAGEAVVVLGGNSFAGNTMHSVARGPDGLLVAVGDSTSIYTSSDGTSWERVETSFQGVSPRDTLSQVIWTGEAYAVSGSYPGKHEAAPLLLVSGDGRSWVESGANRHMGASVDRLVSNGDGEYLGIGGVEVWSGQSIHSRFTTIFVFAGSETERFGSSRISDRAFRDAVYDGSRYLMVGEEGYVAVSDEMGDWSIHDDGPGSDVSRLAYFNGQYIASGSAFMEEPELWLSADGTEWDRINTGGWSGVNRLKEVNGALYGIAPGRLLRSDDGVEWTSERVPEGVTDIFAATDGTLYAVGENGMLLVRR